MAPKSALGRALYQAAYVVTGSATVLIYQWQDDIVVDSGTGRTYSHPIGQVLVVYLAMIGLWIGRRVYLARRRRLPRAHREDPLPPPSGAPVASLASSAGMPLPSFRWYHAAPPGLLHFVSLFLTVLAVKYTTAAVVQILRGAVVIFAAGLTRILLKRTLALYQYFGIAIVILGVILVSAATLQRIPSKRKDPFGSNPLLGDVLIVSAQFFLALRGVLEERVMKQHSVHELELAGWEGVCALGSCIVTVAVGIVWPAAQLDDLGKFVTDMGASKWALISTLLLVAIQPVLQASGLYIIKACSAVTKTVLSQLRIVCVWVPSVLFMGGVVSALQLLGFAVLTFGAIVYTNSSLLRMPRWCYYPAAAPPEPSPEPAEVFADNGDVAIAVSTQQQAPA